jgi:hypothetical protein
VNAGAASCGSDDDEPFELVAEGKSRTDAFAQVGRERGQRPGTVAANYYRTARSQGTTSTERRRTRRSTTTATRRRRGGGRASRSPAREVASVRPSSHDGEVAARATQIAALTQQLVSQVQERDARLRELIG